MKQILGNLLEKILSDIKTDNSNISEDNMIEIVENLRDLTSPEMSKYKACEYLNMSRAKFDNLVREGKLPKGKKRIGFTELFWNKYDLDKAINKINNRNK